MPRNFNPSPVQNGSIKAVLVCKIVLRKFSLFAWLSDICREFSTRASSVHYILIIPTAVKNFWNLEWVAIRLETAPKGPYYNPITSGYQIFHDNITMRSGKRKSP